VSKKKVEYQKQPQQGYETSNKGKRQHSRNFSSPQALLVLKVQKGRKTDNGSARNADMWHRMKQGYVIPLSFF
jgi:hypothetical protein